MSSAAHVPAWRRLGLKLKYAKDEAPISERTEPIITLAETNGHKKRKLSSSSPSPNNGTPAEPVDPAKREAEPIQTKSPAKDANDNHSARSANRASETTRSIPDRKSKSQRKSVSFAADTKLEDGQSAKDLYDAWKTAEDVTTDQGRLPDALQVIDPKPAAKVPKKAKKPKKSKSTLISNSGVQPERDTPSASVTTHSDNHSPLIDYLQTYHADRSNWKFNKARQNQIFKHIFDLDKLPAFIDDALIAYVEGLNSEPVRARIREQALELRQRDIKEGLSGDEDMAGHYGIDTTTSNPDGARNQKDRVSTDKERLHAAYIYAYRRYRKIAQHRQIEQEEEDHQLTDEWVSRLRIRLRLERILQAIGEKVVVPVETPTRKAEGLDFHVVRNVPPAVAASDGGNLKRKRKRKRRTAMPDDDSSSDESSSDEDDDDEEDDRRLMKRFKETSQKVDDETKAAETAEIRAKMREQIYAVSKAKGMPVKDINHNMEKWIDIELKEAQGRELTKTAKAQSSADSGSDDGSGTNSNAKPGSKNQTGSKSQRSEKTASNRTDEEPSDDDEDTSDDDEGSSSDGTQDDSGNESN